MWTNEFYNELLQEALGCDRKFKTCQQQFDDEHKVRIFTGVVLQGKLCNATRWITDHYGGDVTTEHI